MFPILAPNHFHFSADVTRLAALRRFIREQAQRLGADETATADMVQSVDEAAANIILHGYRGEARPIEVTIAREEQCLIVQLHDQAPLFNPTQAPEPDLTLPLHQRPLGKMGIHLIRTLMDEMRYAVSPEGGNTLTLVKKLS